MRAPLLFSISKFSLLGFLRSSSATFACLLMLFCTVGTASGQDITLKQKLVDKRWGLEHYIQNIGTLQDTLFSVHNCQEEFLSLESNGQYEYATDNLRLIGKWDIEDSSTIVLRNAKNQIKLRFFVERVTSDSLVVSELYKKGYFTNVFKVCSLKDNQVSDTRVAYNTYKIQGLNIAASINTNSSLGLEVGYSKGKLLWNNTYMGSALSLEAVTPSASDQSTLMAVSAGGTVNSSLAVSTHFVAYSDFKTVQTGLRVGIGYSPGRLLGQFSRLSHLTLSYNFMFVREGVDVLNNVNAFTLTARYVWPFKYKKGVDKRVVGL